jgi:dCMP deaminase
MDQRLTGIMDWDHTYMLLARDIAGSRSKDPCTQVGAFISTVDHKPLSFGYNGTPRGWDDREFPWGKTSDNDLGNKYKFVVHAERNAILNAPGGASSLIGSILYTTLFPCSECAKEIAQVGIGSVIYGEYRGGEDSEATKLLLDHAGVRYMMLA